MWIGDFNCANACCSLVRNIWRILYFENYGQNVAADANRPLKVSTKKEQEQANWTVDQKTRNTNKRKRLVNTCLSGNSSTLFG